MHSMFLHTASILSLLLWCFPGLCQERETDLLTNLEILRILERSEITYQFHTVSELGHIPAPKDIVSEMYPQLEAPLRYPHVITDKQGKPKLEEYRFDPMARELIRKGEQYYADFEFDLAQTFYRKALRVSPNCYIAYLFLGDCYLMEDQPDSALLFYTKAHEINPMDFRTSFFQATALLKMNNLPQALEYYRKALSLRPRYHIILRTLQKLRTKHDFQLFDNAFYPKALVRKEGEEIHIYLLEKAGPGWFFYGTAKAMWMGEPRFGKAGKKTFSWSFREELQAIFSLITGYVSARASSEEPPEDPYLERLQKIAEQNLLRAFILYEIGSRINPNIMLIAGEDARKEVLNYLKKFVVVD